LLSGAQPVETKPCVESIRLRLASGRKMSKVAISDKVQVARYGARLRS
jgi:hypothetical protein